VFVAIAEGTYSNVVKKFLDFVLPENTLIPVHCSAFLPYPLPAELNETLIQLL
jgi:hypothetical protein